MREHVTAYVTSGYVGVRVGHAPCFVNEYEVILK